MSIVESIRKEIMTLNEKHIAEAEDSYNFWEEHIKYVVSEALSLTAEHNADSEIVLGK